MTTQNLTKTILFDIDKTLLDTDAFVANLTNFHIKNLSKKVSEILTIENNYVNNLKSIYYFDYLKLVKLLSKNQKEEQLLTTNYKNNPNLYPKYNDVLPTLKLLKKQKHQLGIFSEGTPSFQYNKLKNLQINDYINPNLIFIAQSKRNLAFLQQIPAKSIIIDDNSNIIDILTKQNNIAPIFLNRSRKSKHPKTTTIFTLRELESII